ncbi:MAG: hypothetical protein JW925_12365 [Syntrophaceae bacterium]|nr:hypothetical protein [Syntrophaceae bacterium]
MKNKSKCRIPLRPWPPKGTQTRRLSADDAAMIYQNVIYQMYPRYEKFFEVMIDHLPSDVLLLNMGNDIPEFLRKKLENKLKRG